MLQDPVVTGSYWISHWSLVVLCSYRSNRGRVKGDNRSATGARGSIGRLGPSGRSMISMNKWNRPAHAVPTVLPVPPRYLWLMDLRTHWTNRHPDTDPHERREAAMVPCPDRTYRINWLNRSAGSQVHRPTGSTVAGGASGPTDLREQRYHQ